jgi:hypothetical protein
MSEIESSSSQNKTLTQDFLIAEGLADIFAGTGTTSTSLISTIREILLNQAIYDRLHEELKTALPTIETPPDLVNPKASPFLPLVYMYVCQPHYFFCLSAKKQTHFSSEFLYRRIFDTVDQSALDFHVLFPLVVGPTEDICARLDCTETARSCMY